ncbi:MAG: glutamate racemase [Deltaproteobacteria bacterium]|nr:glutamate racemase [Deltaproteobacteria bacterium]
MPDSRPIGIFDSGVGGLTVLKALRTRLPSESFVYLGDTARVPYGTKSPATVIRYSRELAGLLRDRKIKALVVACNTASATAMEALRHDFSLPMTGVIEPGAAAAVESTRSRSVLVLATQATVQSGAYRNAIAARDPAIRIWERACPLFVPLAEEGWTDEVVTQLVAERYIGDLRRDPIDTVVLGCTHYPILRGMIERAVRPGTAIVDSAETTSRAVEKLLRLNALDAPPGSLSACRFLVTDSPERFRSVGERFLGTPLAEVEEIRVGG